MGYILLLVILIFICIFLILRLYYAKRSIKEIEKSFSYILKEDTNNLITISSSDKDIKRLAISLNKNLKDLRKQKLRFENGNQELKNIITNISHDLRTPIVAIKGYAELMEENELLSEQKRYLEVIERKANELTELTNQLFEFSMIGDVNLETQKENCCINEILEETLLSYYSIFKEKNIVPEVKICSKKLYKFINKLSLIRVFENIFSNVCKYSNGDFKVEIKETGTIIFSNNAKSLDSITVQKIFGRYFSVENAKESTGIGLSIAKRLVELNNGKINAKYMNKNLIIEIKF